MKIEGLNPEQQAVLDEIESSLRVTKVVATRALKTRNGDFFVGMSAAWDTVQEDAGGMGADLLDALDEGEQAKAMAQRAMDLRKARVSALVLAMQVDIQAHTHALCGGALTDADFVQAMTGLKRNYAKVIVKAMRPKASGEGEE